MINIVVGGVPEHFNLPWRRLVSSQRLQDSAVQLQWREFPGGTGAMVQALNAGEIDIALLLTEGAVAGQTAGGNFEIVSLYVESPLIWGIHVPATGPLVTVDQLPGQTFAISRYGSGSHLMGLALALREGWDPQALDFRLVGSLDGAVSAFESGDASVFLWERFMTQPFVDRRLFRRIDDLVAPWPAFVVCASRAALDRAGESMRHLVDAVGAEAQAFATSSSAAAEIAGTYGLRIEIAEEWLQRTRWATHLTAPHEAVAAATEMLKLAAVV